MENKKEKTAFNPSVGADERQPIQKIAENSISEYEENIKSFEEMRLCQVIVGNLPTSFFPYDIFSVFGYAK